MKSFFKTVQRMIHYIRPYKWRYITALLITLPIGAMDGVIAWAIKPFIDNILIAKNMSHLIWVPIGIVAFNLTQGGLKYYSTYLNEFLAQRITMALRKDLFTKLQQMELQFFHHHDSGFLNARFYTDPARFQRAMVSTLRVILTKGITAVILATVMIYHSWKLSLVAIGVLSLIVLPIMIFKKRVMRLAHQEVETSSKIMTLLNETFFGIKILLSFNLNAYQRHRFDTAQQENYAQIIKLAQVKGWMAPITHTITAVGMALIIWFGCYQVVQETITTGTFASFIIAMVMLYRPVKGLGDSIIDAQKAMASGERVFELLDDTHLLLPDEGITQFKGLDHAIEYQHIQYGYTEHDNVLKDISLHIKKGETVALVGNSGGGKTTFVELLMGFYPRFKGHILLDGLPLQSYQLASVRQHIAYVSQDTLLFDGTLYDNIALGRLDASEGEIMAAASQAHLSDFIAQLPDGIYTTIGERGIMLSGGQRQRVAVARAILKEASILILDEATSALDNESEALIKQALEALMENRTVIMIAHRLSTVHKADRILVLEQGRIVEEGTHDSLLAQTDSNYNRLYQAQFG